MTASSSCRAASQCPPQTSKLTNNRKVVTVTNGSIINGAQTQGEVRFFMDELEEMGEELPEFHAVEFIVGRQMMSLRRRRPLRGTHLRTFNASRYLERNNISTT